MVNKVLILRCLRILVFFKRVDIFLFFPFHPCYSHNTVQCTTFYRFRPDNLGRKAIEDHLREKLQTRDNELEEFYSVTKINVEEVEMITKPNGKKKRILREVNKDLVYVNDVSGLLYSLNSRVVVRFLSIYVFCRQWHLYSSLVEGN